MKKRILALLLVAAMLTAVLAACGSSSSTTTTTDDTSSTATETTTEEAAPASEAPAESAAAEDEAPADEPVSDTVTPDAVEVPEVSLPFGDGSETHTVWMGISPSAMNYISSLAENQTYQEIMKRTGVNLEFQHFHPDQQTTQFTLICASGEYPCVMNGVANSYTGGPDAAIEQEIFIDHTDLMQEYAPNYWNIIVSDPDLWDAVTTSENQIAGFYSLYTKPLLNDSGYLIRQDYLDDVGLDTPTTPSTLKEVLVAFRDQEGSTDGLFVPSSGVAEFVLGAFGIGTGFYVEDDTIKYGPVEDGFKDYLTYMNDLYSEGLVYQDFPFYGEQMMFRDQGLVGSGAVTIFSNETNDMVAFASDDPDFLLKAIAPIVNEETGIATATEVKPSRADDIRWSLTTGCEEPEHLVQMIDYLYSDEGSLLCNYGIEGVTFEYVDGQPILTDLIVNNPDGLDYRTAMFLNLVDAGPYLIDEKRGTQNHTPEQLSSRDDWANANIDYSGVIPDKAALSQAENEELGLYTTDLETYMDEWVVKFIIGDTSLDQFDEYIAGMKALNVDRCIELYQQAYDRYLEG
jgi:putative aldouronate transport system substrate-binding protein